MQGLDKIFKDTCAGILEMMLVKTSLMPLPQRQLSLHSFWRLSLGIRMNTL